MKIWIDISNAPHVNFFKDFIKEWKRNSEVIVTTRPLSNTIDLLEQNNIDFSIVDTHYGKNPFAKLYGYIKRSNELYKFLKTKLIDISISQSSFYSPYVAWRLGIPSIYTNDNEHAKGNYIAFFFASRILLPEVLEKWIEGSFFRKRVLFYPGIKEGIYVKGGEKKTFKKNQNSIYFRPEPWHAQYHNFSIEKFDKALIRLAKKNKVFVLPRDQKQSDHYSELSCHHTNIETLINVETIGDISKRCDIFLGAGGSMTREFALMGIPTISLYQGKLLETDKYLIKYGLLIHEKDPSKIDQNFIDKLIDKGLNRYDSYEMILQKGREARKLINELITAQ